MTICIKKYLPLTLLFIALFFGYRTLFKYGFDALSNSFIYQLTMLFAVLVYSAVRPPIKIPDLIPAS